MNMIIDFFFISLSLNGVPPGYKLKSNKYGLSDDGMDGEQGVLLLNFIADFWDMIEQYKLINKNTTENRSRRSVKSRPSCSVLIKHLTEKGDILFGHNTWHEYRAMGYR